MIPNHILNSLTENDRIAVLTDAGGIRILVHPASDSPEAIRAHAARSGFGVLATHLQDRSAILELVESREQDVGGES